MPCHRLALAVLMLLAASLSGVAMAGGRAEMWASLSKDRSALITLKPAGEAEYELLTRTAGGRVRVLRSVSASWGVYDYKANMTWPQLAKLPKASRHLWLQAVLGAEKQAIRIDLAEIGGQLLEVDASGVAGKYDPAVEGYSPQN